MKKITLLLMLAYFAISTPAQDSPFSRMIEPSALQRPPAVQFLDPISPIKNIQTLDGRWGIAYTGDSMFRTEDGGATWQEFGIGNRLYETIAAAAFADRDNGYVILSRPWGEGTLLRTTDGGNAWHRSRIKFPGARDAEAELGDGSLEIGVDRLTLSFPITTSSNFVGSVRYVSEDDGVTWELAEKRVDLSTSAEAEDKRSGDWSIKTDGTCAGFKSGCVQETRIVVGGLDITPPKIAELYRIEKELARAGSTQMFAAPPGGATRISLNRGFDKCQAGSVAQMQIWWDNSPHHDTNIYMSGRARACPSQPFTNNPAWIDAVSAQGWGLIPTIVGYQAPCSVSTTPHKFSYDVAVAEQQGRGEADIAVADANSIGLTAGSVLYYDMERYDETVSTPGCRIATVAFLKGWTERIHELGYISGTYGSPTNAVADWWPMPAASRMDAIWMARWDNVMSVWVYNSPSPLFPAGAWANHQRIKQWQAPHNETWGGVTFNIDGNISDGPVAGIAVPKNRTGDFDGDRKTDISVFRPDTGVWYVQKSNGSGYTILTFGLGTDVPTPGDYDGDGKTDQAVFRPADGTWHLLTKAGVYTSRPFGLTGDIPAPADFNGDGKTDLAVYRPSTGVWYIANSDSLGTYTIMRYGLDGDRPVVGDYDGDGKADIAVWRPSSGVWYVSASSGVPFSPVAFGISTDRPAQGDYDGDSKTDLAVLRDGVWYLLQSTAGYSQFHFGIVGDLPVTGDFDGDGKDDAGVFRPTTGIWYLLQSQNGFFATHFGLNGDKPVPNAYLPQ